MNLISKFPEILEESKRGYAETKASGFRISEEINCGENCEADILALGDNGGFMKSLLTERDMEGKIKLIYIDPPFFSKATYDAVINLQGAKGEKLPPIKYFAYDDIWQKDMSAYLSMLCRRLYFMRDLLAEDGTIWVHLDWHIVHYVKIFMDEIFGEENFVNEIVWQYKSGGSGKRHFARKHDTILVYGKSKKYYFAPPKEKSYNRGFKPYRFKGVKEYRDELGWYTMVTMKDVWQVDMVGRTSAERTGYATQKPEALLERIIQCATKEGDLCADFFCGSGTLAAVAQRVGRRWICCDGSPLAVSSTLKRLNPRDIRVLEEERAPEAESPGPQVDIALERTDIVGADREILRVYLQDYRLGDIPPRLEEKGREIIEKVQEESPLSLLEHWSIDFDYDGKVYRPDLLFYRGKGTVETCGEKLMSRGSDRKICVKTVDVLGNCTFNLLT